MYEADLYPAFSQYLKNQHIFNYQLPFFVFTEVRIHPLELDVVSVYKHRKNCFYITCIEVKKNDFYKVFQQALVRTTFCDYCYVAFPIDLFIGNILENIIKNYSMLKEHRIGVLIYDQIRNRIWKVINSTRSKHVTNNNIRKSLLKELNKLSNGNLLKEIIGIERFLKQ